MLRGCGCSTWNAGLSILFSGLLRNVTAHVRLLWRLCPLFGLKACGLPTCVSASQHHEDPKRNGHSLPRLLLNEGYRRLLTCRFGEMVCRTSSALVNKRQRLSLLPSGPYQSFLNSFAGLGGYMRSCYREQMHSGSAQLLHILNFRIGSRRSTVCDRYGGVSIGDH